ncbi:MAG: DUF2892 domain-containing protein [Syntrophales bacterium]|jgi:hypothetical protein|nr:DUF2892 domain-containing protein [Syntrophales bacterium]MDY0043665.1 DUF2892 domain-containing protein [Syntrophales bacterium]
MLPTTTKRVTGHTTDRINEEIRSRTAHDIFCLSNADKNAIDERLKELDCEWNIERALEANAGAFALLGIGLGTFVSKKWFILPGVVAGFLLQHALQGWCPPVPVFRRLGFRTPREIEIERISLKILRGDLKDVSNMVSEGQKDAGRIMESAEA